MRPRWRWQFGPLVGPHIGSEEPGTSASPRQVAGPVFPPAALDAGSKIHDRSGRATKSYVIPRSREGGLRCATPGRAAGNAFLEMRGVAAAYRQAHGAGNKAELNLVHADGVKANAGMISSNAGRMRTNTERITFNAGWMRTNTEVITFDAGWMRTNTERITFNAGRIMAGPEPIMATRSKALVAAPLRQGAGGARDLRRTATERRGYKDTCAGRSSPSGKRRGPTAL